MGLLGLRSQHAAGPRGRSPPRLGWITLSTLAILAGFALWARPAAANDTVSFEIPAQSLASALLQYAEQAELPVLFSEEVVQHHRSSGVTGTYTREEALEKILDGTGLAFESVGKHTVAVTDDGADVLTDGR